MSTISQVIVFLIVLPMSNGTSSSDEYQIGSDEMTRCYKDNLDIENPNNLCNNIFKNILANKPFIPCQTSCIASVYDILPVQYCIGKSVVNCKRYFYESMIAKSQKQFIDLQNDSPTPAVLFFKNGSDTELGIYIFNHQHMAFALASSYKIPDKLKYLKICIVNDMRKIYKSNEMDLFWKYMINIGYSYPYNQYYIYENPVQYIPSNILQLVDDPFRSLAIYIEDYMGFIFCAISAEDVHHLNFSKCFGKNGIEWNKKYGNIGLSLIWSQFLYNKLKDNEYVKKIYVDSNNYKVLDQMKLFRKLLPIAMNVVLNGSDGADTMPSFNNQPYKIADLDHLILYDNGCDEPMEQQIISQNWTQYDKQYTLPIIDKVSSVGLIDKYFICVGIAGIIAILIELKRYCDKRMKIHEKHNLVDISMGNYGSIK